MKTTNEQLQEAHKRIKSLEQLVLDLQKRLSWAQENADMRKIYLDQMTQSRDYWHDLYEQSFANDGGEK